MYRIAVRCLYRRAKMDSDSMVESTDSMAGVDISIDSMDSVSSALDSMTISQESMDATTSIPAIQASFQPLNTGMPSPPVIPRKKVSRKVELKPGHSLTHWINRTKGGEDMTGIGALSDTRVISLQELAQHCTICDCWMAIRGKVYDVTKYLDYHPGGVDILMKEAGKEATALFDKNHRWVNIDRLLASCQVGVLKTMTLAI